MWSTIVGINSVLCALAWIYAVYAAGASIYYASPWPILWGALLVFFLMCTEVLFSIIEESAGH